MHLAQLTWPEAAKLFSTRPVALWPVGSTEPHGPHLSLRTDVIIAEGMAARALPLLAGKGLTGMVLPSLPVGVTQFGRDFAGALSVPASALVGLVEGVAQSLKRDGARCLVLVNAHLEPGHLAALHEAAAHATKVTGLPVIFPDKTRKDIARTLSAEFKSGACHAGEYETSLVLAQEPGAVRMDVLGTLPTVDISLSRAIRDGKDSFLQAGGDHAYFGHPATASAAHGEEQFALLAAALVEDVMRIPGLMP